MLEINQIYEGDCLEVMREMEPDTFDGIVTDPPYGLQFMGKEWDKLWRNQTEADKQYVERTANEGDGLTSRARSLPDYSAIDQRQMQEWHYHWAVEALRVAKPGAHMLAFGGTRTFHRLACAIEDAGWEIRDTIMWVYGSGFPKSLDVSKAIDKAAGAERPDAIIGGHRGISTLGGDAPSIASINLPTPHSINRGAISRGTPATEAAQQWQGWGTALKPAWEPIIVARKPLEGTVAANVLKWGTGGINVDGGRIGTNGENPKPGGRIRSKRGKFESVNDSGYELIDAPDSNPQGRFPANLIHDGSDEVLELFPVTGNNARINKAGGCKFFMDSDKRINAPWDISDAGSAARFFYCAKASRSERGNGNNHPTVKPLALLVYLVKLITPEGALILDPFGGSGSTAIACRNTNRRYVLIEKEHQYVEIARKRIAERLL